MVRRWGGSLVLYTLRSSGAQGFTLLRFYRHIAPLERKIAQLPGRETCSDTKNNQFSITSSLRYSILSLRLSDFALNVSALGIRTSNLRYNTMGSLQPPYQLSPKVIIPLSKGGTDHPENLQLLCSSCNRIKGNQTQEAFITILKERELRR